MRRDVEQLEKDTAARVAQIQTLERQANTDVMVEGVDASELPRVVAVAFERFTGVVDTDGDGVSDLVRVYLRTTDQHGRFMPAAGSVVLQLVVISPGKGPVVLAERAYSPREFHESYRSGLTGTHYTLEVELPAPLPDITTPVTLKAVFTDAATGVGHSVEQAVSF